MTDNENRPDKIDLDEFLGETGGDEGDSGEIEILDPRTGESAGGESGFEPAEPGVTLDPGQEETGSGVDYQGLYVRARADFENLRKRTERERAETETLAGCQLVREILPVLDDLQRALQEAPPGDPFVEGVRLIERQLMERLEAAGLSAIQAEGQPFDPVYHEAVDTRVDAELGPNRVVDEIRRGYMFRGRVIRPSVVRVSVRPEQDPRMDSAGGES